MFLYQCEHLNCPQYVILFVQWFYGHLRLAIAGVACIASSSPGTAPPSSWDTAQSMSRGRRFVELQYLHRRIIQSTQVFPVLYVSTRGSSKARRLRQRSDPRARDAFHVCHTLVVYVRSTLGEVGTTTLNHAPTSSFHRQPHVFGNGGNRCAMLVHIPYPAPAYISCLLPVPHACNALHACGKPIHEIVLALSP